REVEDITAMTSRRTDEFSEATSARPPVAAPCRSIAVDGVGRERGQADGDVVRTLRSAVAHPLAGGGVHRLAGACGKGPTVVLDVYGAIEHDGPLVEVRLLPGFGPAGRARHVRDRHPRLAGVD